jgi:hypothetical protein
VFTWEVEMAEGSETTRPPRGYRPLRAWTWAVSLVVVLGTVLLLFMSLIGPMTEAFALGLGPEPELDSPRALQFLLLALVNFGTVMALLATALLGLPLWAVWHWRAAQNLRALGEPLELAPVWHVLSWLIPVVNVVMPYLVMRELLLGSPADKQSMTTRPASLPLWWVASLCQQALGGISLVFMDHLIVTSLLDWLSLPLMFVSNALYLWYIHQIDREQAERVTG